MERRLLRARHLLGERDDARAAIALDAVVRASEARVAGATLAALGEGGSARGRVRVASREVACAVVLVREIDDGDNWVDLAIPLESLSRVEPRVGGYPFDADDSRSLAWRTPIDAWLTGIARAVFAASPFRFAVIGMEVSGERPPPLTALEGPSARYVTTLMPVAGALRVFAATR